MATNTITAPQSQPSKALHVGIWGVQVLLAAFFIMVGSMKLLTPIETLAQSLAWVTTASPLLVKFIGFSELAGGLGLVLPAMTRVLPRLTPLAASGLLTIMVLASGFHLMRGEASAIGMNLVLGAMALFIAWGRFKKAPILSRY